MEALKIIATSQNKQLTIELPDNFISKRLEIVVFPADEEDEWKNQSITGLNNAYGDNEPDYTNQIVKEPNEQYGKR